jgi:hypothetical protein
MTAAARAISEDNLGRRLAEPGPGDELKDLGDAIDGLLDQLQAACHAQANRRVPRLAGGWWLMTSWQTGCWEGAERCGTSLLYLALTIRIKSMSWSDDASTASPLAGSATGHAAYHDRRRVMPMTCGFVLVRVDET